MSKCRIFIYKHRRMAITAKDVSLEDIIPISFDFAVAEGELLSCILPQERRYCLLEWTLLYESIFNTFDHALLYSVSLPGELAVVGELPFLAPFR